MMGRTGYSVHSYGQMVTCEPRMSAYARSLAELIKPGDIVIDIGAGPGIFSLLACQYGAGSVIAIEPHNTVELLKAAGAANGYANQITIAQCLSTDYQPRKKADLIVSDLRGTLPLFEHHIPAVIDARERLLKKTGHLVPKCDHLFASLVAKPELWTSTSEPWLHNAYNLDLTNVFRYGINQWRKVYLKPEDLASNPQEIASLDYATVQGPDLSVSFAMSPDGPGTVHGFLIWFDTTLVPGVGYSNAPGQPELVYGQAYFPFERPLTLKVGDEVSIDLRANLVGDEYVWSWFTNLLSRDGTSKSKYRQSTLAGRVLSTDQLRMQSADFIPPPQDGHAINRRCLELIDGKRSQGEIAEELMTVFPMAFANSQEALTKVIKIAGNDRSGAVINSAEQESNV